MKISKRLMGIVNFVPKNSIVGDIGTDHGYIPIYLIKNNISKKVIATDISKDSLQKTVDYIKDKEYKSLIDTRLGNGLEPIKPYEIDTVIIAGMGGVLIKDILEENREKTNSIINFIFQPMTASKELRKYLIENKFKIVKEDLIKEDNKFYEIIYAKEGLETIEKDIYLEIGKSLLDNNHPLLEEFLQYKINGLEKIIMEIKDIETEKSKEKYKGLKELIKDYKEVLVDVKGR